MKAEIRTFLISGLTALVFVLVSSFFQNYISRAEFDEHRIEFAKVTTKLDNIQEDITFIRTEVLTHLKEKH